MEERRLAELARDKAAVDARRDGRETRRLLKEHDTLEKVVAELYRFREALKEAADSGYDPDLDDGVVLSIAPLHRLTPWKEVRRLLERTIGRQVPLVKRRQAIAYQAPRNILTEFAVPFSGEIQHRADPFSDVLVRRQRTLNTA